MRISDWSSDLCSSDLLAPAAALGRTEGAMEEFTGKVLNEDIVQGMTSFAGFDLLAGALKSYAGASFITLKDWEERTGPGQDSESRSEEHTSELQYLMRISYAVFCLKNKQKNTR